MPEISRFYGIIIKMFYNDHNPPFKIMEKLTSIIELEHLGNYHIKITFSDGLEKTIDFSHFIKEDPLTSKLKDLKYFSQVKLYARGRGIYWPNGYDFCPDFLRMYSPRNEFSPA